MRFHPRVIQKGFIKKKGKGGKFWLIGLGTRQNKKKKKRNIITGVFHLIN